MRPSLLLALAFFSAQIDLAQAPNDHRIGCARFSYEQDLPNCKGEERTGVRGTRQVAQASSRTGGFDVFPGGQAPGGIANQYSPDVGGAYPGGTYSGGQYPGGQYPGGTQPGGIYPGGGYPTGGPSVLPGGHPRDVTR
jgi:hypothetical protein